MFYREIVVGCCGPLLPPPGWPIRSFQRYPMPRGGTSRKGGEQRSKNPWNLLAYSLPNNLHLNFSYWLFCTLLWKHIFDKKKIIKKKNREGSGTMRCFACHFTRCHLIWIGGVTQGVSAGGRANCQRNWNLSRWIEEAFIPIDLLRINYYPSHIIRITC